LTLLKTLPSASGIRSSLCQQRGETVTGQLYITLGHFLCPFFECMQNIDSFGKRRNIQDPVLKPCVNPDFPITLANDRDRLPVVWIKPPLYSTQLKSSNLPRIRQEGLEFIKRRSEPEQGLIGPKQYTSIYITGQARAIIAK
jgi:hypothetical protein